MGSVEANEKLFVDYAGQTVGIVSQETGESIHNAQIFVTAPKPENWNTQK
jgi:hypothetical protein